MLEQLSKLMTKNHTEVPLFFVNLDLVKFQENGAKGSCTANVHPSLRDDPFVIEQLNGLIDHIREHHDMEKLV